MKYLMFYKFKNLNNNKTNNKFIEKISIAFIHYNDVFNINCFNLNKKFEFNKSTIGVYS